MRSIAWREGILAAAWVLFCATTTFAQEDDPATPAARDALFAELARDVAHLEQEGSILKRVVRLVRPSVVHIDANRDAESTRTGLTSGVEEAGSGVLIERAGKFYVVTNRHVVKFSTLEGIVVKLADGRLLRPTQIWSDHATDLAILAVPGRDLVAARIGDSTKIDIGDFVLAVGSPFGLSHSVTYGIISAKGRRDLQLGDDGVVYQDFLQTDAAINPGNSGGPLLNLRGEVIGLNTAIASASGGNEGIGFAIPINMVMLVAEQLIDKGSVSRAFLGVRLDAAFGPEAALRAGLARPQGARVSGVTKGSPAEAAELRVGDVILSFDGTRVDDDNHLINLVSLTPVEREVDVRVLRDGTVQTIKVRVANRTPGPSQ
ncbi:MAG: trypsin-like peptidase domain-containing protein [Pirellulaceae bacterium]|jgi:serine protease Do|nr:trypsin-like peptidase domain-containing protein [Pirellulaceae bacterium]